MNRKMTALALVLFGPTFAPMAAAGTVSPPAAISDAEAHSIGVEAYLYFYPLVTMELTREQLTNVEPGKEPGRGPMNAFANVAEFPSADFKAVVRPNFDTLYSIAWLDLTKEPMIVSVPDTGGRYYLMPMLDMWTDAFAAPGWRTTCRRASWAWPPSITGRASTHRTAVTTSTSERRSAEHGGPNESVEAIMGPCYMP